MYKLFPFLHLTQSNIAVIWMPTGFRDNMSRMLKEISNEEAQYQSSVVPHEGKLYITKENLYEKYLDRHEKVFSLIKEFCRCGSYEPLDLKQPVKPFEFCKICATKHYNYKIS